MLHGIYEAAGHGMMNINPYAWASDGGDTTEYPAQVKVRVRKPCKSLREEQIKDIIRQNYFDPKDKRRFWHELTHAQTGQLLSLFESASLLDSSSKRKSPMQKPRDRAILKLDAKDDHKNSRAPSNWASLFKENLNTDSKLADEQLVSESYLVDHENSRAPSSWASLFKNNLNTNLKRADGQVVSESYLDEKNQAYLNQPIQHPDPSMVIDNWEDGIFWDVGTRQSGVKPFWEEKVGPSGSSPSWEEELQTDQRQSIKGANEDEDEYIYYKGKQRVLDRENSVQKIQGGKVSVPFVMPYVEGVCSPTAPSTSGEDDSDSEEDIFYPCATHWEVKKSFVSTSTSKKDNINSEADIKTLRSRSEKYGYDLMSSSDVRSTVDQLRQELKEAKVYSVDQHRKATALERKLDESSILLQHLRHRVMLLESHLLDSLKSGTQKCNDSRRSKEFTESYDEFRVDSHELIYLMGGYDGESWLQTMDCYLPSSDMLKPLKPMNCARSHASAAVLNGLIYSYGGWHQYGKTGVWYDTVECYNPWSNKWISCAPLGQKKGCLAGACVNNKIYAIGGGNGKDCFKEVEMFDPVLERWIPTRSMLQKRFASAAGELDSIIYVAGGYDGKHYLKSAERFDPREGCWSRLPSMNTSRGSHVLTVFKGKLYALGGYDGNKYVSSVEVYDPCMGSWLEVENMKQPRGSFAAPVIGGTIFTIGGHAEGNKIVDTVETYRIGHGWSVSKLKGIGNRCFFSCVHTEL